MMRIAIVTDAWHPQVNGVVRTLEAMERELGALGHDVLIVSPLLFASMPCPTYSEIRLAFPSQAQVGRQIGEFCPDAIHLATEGPVGLAVRRWCLAQGYDFTTAYHTQFPEYVAARTPAPAEWVWKYLRWFHGPAQSILAATPSVATLLRRHRLMQVRAWGRGVDFRVFGKDGALDPDILALPGPILLYVGRVAIEKNIEAFLSSEHAGSKVIVGDGPARVALERKYPDAHFLGPRSGEALAAAYRSADALVFPSRTDTFGLVMIEALACGTPVAAPVPGPSDVLDPRVGAMAENLDTAIAAALQLDRVTCSAFAARFSWAASARQFVAALAPVLPQAQAA